VLAGIATDVANAVLRAFGNAVLAGLAHLAGWAIAGVIHAVVATTTINPDTVMGPTAGPWRAMVTVAAMAALPILLVAVAQAALRGDPAELARRGLAVPLGVAVGLATSEAVLVALLAGCSWASGVLVDVGAGGQGHLSQVWGHLAVVLGGSGEAVSSTLGMPGAATGLLLLVAALAALTVWIELSVRAALLYLLAAMVPLALAGLFWRRLSSWAVRLAEVILAVALSQVVITAALVVGSAVVERGLQPGQGPAATSGGLLAGVGLLLLASLGLPITLSVVPIAVDAAVHAGAGRQALAAARHHGEGVRAAISQPALASSPHRLATAPIRAVRAGVVAATAPAAALVGRRQADDGDASTSHADPPRSGGPPSVRPVKPTAPPPRPPERGGTGKTSRPAPPAGNVRPEGPT
jgi:hypothetical protein